MRSESRSRSVGPFLLRSWWGPVGCPAPALPPAPWMPSERALMARAAFGVPPRCPGMGRGPRRLRRHLSAFPQVPPLPPSFSSDSVRSTLPPCPLPPYAAPYGGSTRVLRAGSAVSGKGSFGGHAGGHPAARPTQLNREQVSALPRAQRAYGPRERGQPQKGTQ